MKHIRAFAVCLGVGLLGVPMQVQAQEHHTIVSADDIKWGAAPPSLPGVGSGRRAPWQSREGRALRLKFPPGFAVPPHRHSKNELVTVISGKFGIGASENLDHATAKQLPPGSFVHLPAGMPHYAVADAETVVQINGKGPFDVTFIDPKDDPRKKPTIVPTGFAYGCLWRIVLKKSAAQLFGTLQGIRRA